MERRYTDASSDNFRDYRTPEGSLKETERLAPMPSAALRSEVTDRNRVPSYTENPYQAEQFHAEQEPLPNTSVPFPAVLHEPTHVSASTASHSISTQRRNIGESIRGMFRRSSVDTSRSHDGSKNDDEKKEDEIKTAEDYGKRMEDPQYLLNTIMEEAEGDENEQMTPIGEAAAELGISSTDGAAASNLKERRQGYRENLLRTKKLRKYTKASRSIAVLRKWFNKIMSWALVFRVFVYWFPLALILFIPLAVGAWQNPNLKIRDTRVMWLFIWIEVVWGSLWIGKLFAHYMPEFIGFFISVLYPKKFKYVDMVLALELPVQLIIWTFITFITFPSLLMHNPDAPATQPKWQHIVQDICVALLVSAIVFLVEQCFIYLVSTNFHRERMALRIGHQKKSVDVLIILLNMAYSFFPRGCHEFEEEDGSLQFVTLQRAQKLMGGKNHKNSVLRTVNGIVGSAAKNVQNFVADTASKAPNKVSVAKVVKNALTKADTREVLANRIWKSLVMEDSSSLTYEDLISVFGMEKKEEVLYMFDILDSDGQDGIDLGEMIESIHRIGRESKQISKSLVDMNGAINKLHYLLMCISLILIVVIFVGMLAPASATVLATFGSTLISMSWLFATTAQEVFQACVFLFVKHPYDVGDWIQVTVPSLGLVRMRVAELNLMYTVFNQIGVNTRRQVSNSVLNTLFIDNISRSPPSQVSIVIPIGIPETTAEQLTEFEIRLNEFVEENPREYAPGVFFHVIDQTQLDRFSLNVCINTRNNQDDIVLFSDRRTKALEFIGRCINDIPITLPRRDETAFNDPAAPVFHYNIDDLDKAMEYAEKAKGRRRNAGMLAPKTDEELYTEVRDEEENQANRGQENTGTNNPGYQFDRRRRLSMTSRRSQISRAFSSTSRTSNAVGLRSRRNQRPMAAAYTSAAAAVSEHDT